MKEEARDRAFRIAEDVASLERRHPLHHSSSFHRRLIAFLEEEAGQPSSEGVDGFLVDWWLRRRLWDHRFSLKEAQALESDWPFLPLADSFLSDHFNLKEFPGREAGARLHQMAGALRAQNHPLSSLALSRRLKEIQKGLESWSAFHQPYSPELSWWTKEPFHQVVEELGRWVQAASEQGQDIPGTPIGADALEELLRLELIPHSAEELIAAADREEAWCTEEMLKASRELGCSSVEEGLEMAKEDHEHPGGQALMVRDLAQEAIRLIEEQELMTLPPLMKECWRMEMMPMERQREAPFFLGGETIMVSYPTSEMDHEWKEMALRGNNRAFSRATVQHELIPGHHVQQFFNRRHNPHRQLFYTPFWVEGWTLHWEMLWWDLGFPRTPRERLGMLFWRRHRAARVVFSLRFHQGLMTPQMCVDHLVDKVGHERSCAEAEVRRSFGGDYDPLYQAAYLIGGFQVRELHRECLQAGWSHRQFHDRFIREGMMPISVARSLLLGATMGEDWRFLDGRIS